MAGDCVGERFAGGQAEDGDEAAKDMLDEAGAVFVESARSAYLLEEWGDWEGSVLLFWFIILLVCLWREGSIRMYGCVSEGKKTTFSLMSAMFAANPWKSAGKICEPV